MTGEESRIRIIVRSKNVPVGIFESNYGQNLVWGSYSNLKTKHLKFERILDEDQERLVNGVRSLANMLGVQVEVIDLGKESVAKRLFRTLARKTLKAPSIVLPVEVWSGFDSSALLFQMISKKQPLDYRSVIELITSHVRVRFEIARERNEKKPLEEAESILTV